MDLDSLPLPPRVIKHLKRQGISGLFPPQAEAIRAGLLEGRNVVVAAPTASGKTLIAVLAALKHVIVDGGKVLYLTPLRALANEKFEEFRGMEELGVRAALSTGDFDSSDPWLGSYDVIVTTNEKADSLIRHRAPWLDALTLVVADEIHLISSGKRGPTLEMLLAKMKKLKGSDFQVVALSATIRNIDDISAWLGAVPVVSTWRPVELREGVYYESEITFSDGSCREVPLRYGPIIDLVVDCIGEGGQALVFVPTRNAAVSYSRRIARILSRHLSLKEKRKLAAISSSLTSAERNIITEKLGDVVRSGVAFHHAGLSHRARKLVESTFRDNVLKVVVATPTLAAGVNLPARRVVISDYRRYNVEVGYYERIPVMEYKQMAGRAGRPQYDNYGESVLVARTSDEFDILMEDYVKAEPERIYSKLASEPVLRSHILASIASGYARSMGDLMAIMGNTLYARQFNLASIRLAVASSLHFLEAEDMVYRENGGLLPTEVGKRTSELYIDPRSAAIIVKKLSLREEAGVIGYLHMVCSTPDMPKLYLRKREREELSEVAEELSGEFLGSLPLDPAEYEFFLAEVKTALLLYDWIEERDDNYMFEKYNVGPGDLYSLTQTADWLLYASSELAKIKGFLGHLRALIVLRDRVRHGVREELLGLVRIKGIGRVRARFLYNRGFRDIEDIAKADVRELALVPRIGPSLARKLKEAALNGSLEIAEEGLDASGTEEVTLEKFM